MDVRLVAAISALETAILLRNEDVVWMVVAKVWLGLLLAQYALSMIYSFFIYPHFVSPLRHLPGPKDNHFFIGQTAKMMAAPSPHSMYQKWTQSWPDAPFIRQLGIGNQELLIVNSLAAHKECLGTHGNDFVKAKFFEKLLEELLPGATLFTTGEEHKRRRRLLAGPLSLTKVRKLVPVFLEKAKELMALLASDLDAGGDGTWELETNLSKLSLDVIGITALGLELNQLRSNSSMNFHECYSSLLQPSQLGAVIMFLNAFVPLRWLPLESNKSFIKANNTIQGMIRGVVHQRAEDVKVAGREGKSEETDAGDSRRDLLTYMLEETLPGGDRLSEAEICHSLFELMAAGHDTTASAMTYTIYELAMRPELQERCRAEVLRVLGDQPELDTAVLEKLDFMNNFIREALRMYSPTVNSVREAAKDMAIEGVPIAKGTTIVIAPAVVQWNPSIWGPDANKFDPDRWARLEGSAASPYAFGAFNNGPRICPGKQYAMLEIKATVAELLRTFRLEPVDVNIQFQNPTLTLKPKGPMRIRVRRLENA